MELLGRSEECKVLNDLLARSAEGYSATLVLRGEPGVGKTALLDYLIVSAASAGLQTARLAGVESETQLGYAGLHRFLLPFGSHIDRLPAPQRDAIRSTFGLITGPPADRFLVALGVLTLLADVASEAPLAYAVDDAQWLDPESAVVLGFVARRLYAERVVLVFVIREPADQSLALSALPELAISALGDRDASELLSSVTSGHVSAHVGARLVFATGGNPLALLELAKELSPAQLVGAAALLEPLPVADSLMEVFGRRINRLPPETQLMLAVAAAEPTGTRTLLWRAVEQLGIDPEAAASADVSHLVEIGLHVTFRHPLVRSVAYHNTPPAQRRLVHRALAQVTDAADQPDRVAWHLGMAAIGPDDGVAAQLGRAAERVRERGGYAATVTFLSRAAELSVDEGLRTARLLAASDAALTAGQHLRASELLDEARARPVTELQAGMALRLSGEICFATGQNEDARSLLLAAARSLMPMDAALGRQTLLLALQAANFSGRGAVEELCSVAGGLLSPARAVNTQATALDYLLFGLLHRFAAEPRQAAALFRRAVEELRGGNVPDQLRWLLVQLGSSVPSELFDDEAKAAVAAEYVRLARARGALTVLPMALLFLADVHIREGRFGDAEAAYTERYDLGVAMGNPGIVAGDSLAKVPLLVWRGREAEARAASADASADAEGRGLGGAGVSHVRSRLAVLELSLGNYRQAFGHAQYVADEDLFVWGTYVLPDLVEAAVRCNERAAAGRAVDRLSARARASGAPWGLGLLAYSRALLAEEADAEQFHQEAIAVLDTTRTVTDLARAHLVYGEWLRRQRRRRDARTHLRTAHEMFADMGADAFAGRARIELEATGEHAHQRNTRPALLLTPRETQIARLVSEGHNNRDIASQLFVSPSTVDYHLRKIFLKLGVKSRTRLVRAMVAHGAGPVGT